MLACFANIEFIQVADGGVAIGDGTFPTIRILGANIPDSEGDTWGFGYYPSASPEAGDIAFDLENLYSLTAAQLQWLATHEIGHALGLLHNPSLSKMRQHRSCGLIIIMA